MTILVNLAINIACGFCKFMGELYFHDFERFIIPPLIVFGIGYNSHIWWLGLPSLLMIGDLVEGYGVNSWMRKLLGDAGAQGMWMFGACFLAGIFPVIMKHCYFSWGFLALWSILAGVLGATTRNLNNKYISWIKGLWMGAIFWFIH